MKKLITALAFTVFCVTMPVLLAKAVAQESDSGPRIEIQAEGVSPEQEDSIRTALEGVGDVLGKNARAELEIQLGDLSEIEKKELSDALKQFSSGDHFTFGAGGIGFGETIVAMTALFLSLGLPVIILVLVLVYAQKKRRQMMELAGMYIKADQPMPEHVIAEFGSGMSPDKRYRSGLQLVFVGIALTIVLGTYAGEAATLGFIPMAIGLARIIYWRYERNKTPEQELIRDQSEAGV